MFFFKLPRPRRSIRPDTLLPYTTLCLSADIPVVSRPRVAGKARVIAGEYRGAKGPAKTFTPINVRDLSLKADTDLKLDLPLGHTAMIVVLTGHVTIEGSLGAGETEMVLLGREGRDVEIHADG